MSSSYAPLIELTRGGIVESIHFGAFAIVNSKGDVITSHGDPGLVAFPRSSEKPFQALPFLEQGGDHHYNLTPCEIAILCASHTGSEAHMEVIRKLQNKTGVDEKHLLCGVHPPSDQAALKMLADNGMDPTPNRNNCSGKHTGMLAHAALRNFPFEDYIDPVHPLQQVILNSFADMCDMDIKDIITGIDGCSAPNFAVPLTNFALAVARLVDPSNLTRSRADACMRLTNAMTSQPDMVSGPNRFDTKLMELGKGRILSKAGAEGYQAIGLFPGALSKDSPGIGIALKVSDGDTSDYQTAMHAQFDGDDPFILTPQDIAERARPCAIVELLRQLGGLEEEALFIMRHHASRPIYNWRKLPVGEIRPCFHISS